MNADLSGERRCCLRQYTSILSIVQDLPAGSASAGHQSQRQSGELLGISTGLDAAVNESPGTCAGPALAAVLPCPDRSGAQLA